MFVNALALVEYYFIRWDLQSYYDSRCIMTRSASQELVTSRDLFVYRFGCLQCKLPFCAYCGYPEFLKYVNWQQYNYLLSCFYSGKSFKFMLSALTVHKLRLNPKIFITINKRCKSKSEAFRTPKYLNTEEALFPQDPRGEVVGIPKIFIFTVRNMQVQDVYKYNIKISKWRISLWRTGVERVKYAPARPRSRVALSWKSKEGEILTR